MPLGCCYGSVEVSLECFQSAVRVWLGVLFELRSRAVGMRLECRWRAVRVLLVCRYGAVGVKLEVWCRHRCASSVSTELL